MDGGNGEFVARERAGLIRAQHVDAGRFIHGGKPGWKNAQLSQSLGAERRGKRKGGGQGYRDRRQNRGEQQRNDLANRHVERARVAYEDHDDHAIADGEIAYHAHDGFLLGTFDVRGAHQLRGASELGACPGGGDFRYGFAAPHQRSRIGFESGAGFDRHGFAGEHGLVEQHRAIGQTHVGGNYGAER